MGKTASTISGVAKGVGDGLGAGKGVIDAADTMRGWNQHHTNVANDSGRSIYVRVRSPGRVDDEQIPAGSSVSFATQKGQVTVIVYDNGDRNNARSTKTIDSDRSVIVKSGFHMVYARYGKVWQEE